MTDTPVASAIAPTDSPHGLDYAEALRRASSLVDFERSKSSPDHSAFHLERMGALMERLGRPHLGIPTLHVAGTNGKGSTAAMLTSVLAAGGYRTGLYTSPSLHSPTERIRVGLEPVTRQVFADLVGEAWPAVEWVGEHAGYGGVSYFELLTAMAFLHFDQIEAGFQVIEVGLGGRLDATNVVAPAVCVITSISLDHVRTLGGTLAEIAGEKAGIIKPGVPVVVAPQAADAMAVIMRVAEERGSPAVQVGRDVTWQRLDGGSAGQAFEVSDALGGQRLWMPLLGEHQIENASAAVAALHVLAERGYELSRDAVSSGFRAVKWPARLQVLRAEGPLVVADGAHNQDGMQRTVQALREAFHFRKVFVVFGVLGGHDAGQMLDELKILSPVILAASSREPRARPSAEVAKEAIGLGLEVAHTSESVGEATSRAIELAGKDDLVLGAGSLSVAAEVIEEMQGVRGERYDHMRKLGKSPAQSGPGRVR